MQKDPCQHCLSTGAAVTEQDADNEDGAEEGGRVGLLLSSKAWVQLAANPVVGALTSSLGTRLPLLAGSVNLVLAAMCTLPRRRERASPFGPKSDVSSM